MTLRGVTEALEELCRTEGGRGTGPRGDLRVQILERMDPQGGWERLAVGLGGAQEEPPADGCLSRIVVSTNLALQLLRNRHHGNCGPPFALAEVDPAIVAQSYDVDLNVLVPI